MFLLEIKMDLDEIIKDAGVVSKSKLGRLVRGEYRQKMTELLKSKVNIDELNPKEMKALTTLSKGKLDELLPKPERKIKVSQHGISLRQFDNYIGGWYFDILYGRDPERTDNGPLIGIYINGNSKYCWFREMPDRTELECNRIHATFIGWCRDNKVPLIKVRSDAEKGMSNMVYVEQHVAQGEHHFLGPINGFASAVRHWIYKTYGESFIRMPRFEHFVEKVWNRDEVRGTHSTRTEMLFDRNLEEAYICKMLYYNVAKREERENLIQEGTEVEIRHTDMKQPFERRYGRLIHGKYKVVSTDDKNYVEAEDERGERQKFYYSQIAGVKTVDDEMLSSVVNKKTSVKLEKIPETKTKDTERKALDYEAEIEKFRSEIISEVVEQLNERREADLANGFKPITKPIHLNEAYEQTKTSLLNDKSKYSVKYIPKRPHIKKVASEILNQIFDTVNKNQVNESDVLKGGKVIYKRKPELRNKIVSILEPTKNGK
jgi:hypothetical protein